MTNPDASQIRRENAGKNVLVIGATGGVGRVTAILLKDAGFNVIASCRSEEQKAKLEEGGICHTALLLDLGNNESIEAAFVQLREMGTTRLAGLINCAAVTHLEALETMTQEQLESLFQINVFGTLLAAKCAIPFLRENQGRIIMVGSVGGSMVLPLLGAYCASKFAVEAICDALRRELEPWHIHVSMVNPGAITTNMAKGQIKDLGDIIASPPPTISKEYLQFYKRHKKAMQLGYEHGVTPERVARDIHEALTDPNPKSRYYPGMEPQVVSRLSKILPDSIKDRLLKVISPDE